MTIQGAMNELVNLLNADDIPIYYKGGIKKVIETIDDYINRKTKPTTEDSSTVPTSSKMEQVEDEPQTEDKCKGCQWWNKSYGCHWKEGVCHYVPKAIIPKQCVSCDSASRIIEAYSRGFEDGADAVKAMPQTEGIWNAGYKTGYDKGCKDAQKVNESQCLVEDLVEDEPQK